MNHIYFLKSKNFQYFLKNCLKETICTHALDTGGSSARCRLHPKRIVHAVSTCAQLYEQTYSSCAIFAILKDQNLFSKSLAFKSYFIIYNCNYILRCKRMSCNFCSCSFAMPARDVVCARDNYIDLLRAKAFVLHANLQCHKLILFLHESM